MTNLRKFKLLALILMLLPILQSCAQTKSRVTPKSSAKKAAPVRDSSKTTVKTPAPVRDSSKTSTKTSARVANLAKKHMEAGECQKAINVYVVVYRKHPNDQALVNEYVKSIENIKSAADNALYKENFASAGRKYGVLQKNYAHFKRFEKKLSFKNTYLDEKIYYCKKVLFIRGFQEYRKENLSEAIALWQDLLSIDPQDADIKKLLKTAKVLQKNLQEKE